MQDPESFDYHPGVSLRRLRRGQGISLVVFAQRIGVSDADARSYENETARIPVRVLRRAAEILGVHMTDLFRADAVPDAEPPPTVH